MEIEMEMKKWNWKVWLVIGIVGLVLILGTVIGLGIRHKAKQLAKSESEIQTEESKSKKKDSKSTNKKKNQKDSSEQSEQSKKNEASEISETSEVTESDATGGVGSSTGNVSSGTSSSGTSSGGNASQGSGSQSGPTTPTLPSITPHWAFYGSASHQKLTAEQKQYIDGLVSAWTSGQATADQTFQSIESYLDGQGVEFVNLSVNAPSRVIYHNLDEIPDYNYVLQDGCATYFFEGVYLDGTYDEYRDVNAYIWEVIVL